MTLWWESDTERGLSGIGCGSCGGTLDGRFHVLTPSPGRTCRLGLSFFFHPGLVLTTIKAGSWHRHDWPPFPFLIIIISCSDSREKQRRWRRKKTLPQKPKKLATKAFDSTHNLLLTLPRLVRLYLTNPTPPQKQIPTQATWTRLILSNLPLKSSPLLAQTLKFHPANEESQIPKATLPPPPPPPIPPPNNNPHGPQPKPTPPSLGYTTTMDPPNLTTGFMFPEWKNLVPS